MPTASRLVAAAVLAAMGWCSSFLIAPLMVEDPPFEWFAQINAAAGFVVGWTVTGPRIKPAAKGIVVHGLTGAFAWVFWALLAHSTIKMLELSLRKQYDQAMEAVIAVFEIAFEDLQVMASGSVIFVVLGGGVLAAYLGAKAAQAFDKPGLP